MSSAVEPDCTQYTWIDAHKKNKKNTGSCECAKNDAEGFTTIAECEEHQKKSTEQQVSEESGSEDDGSGDSTESEEEDDDDFETNMTEKKRSDMRNYLKLDGSVMQKNQKKEMNACGIVGIVY